jgi:hypothetical protein
MLTSYNSMNDYLTQVRDDVGLDISPVNVIPPVGPAADRYLWDAIRLCCFQPTSTVSFTAPCIRRECYENIQAGSHLSLFFLMMIVIGAEVNSSRRDDIFNKITGVISIEFDTVLAQSCKEFMSDSYSFRQKYVPSANNFDCTGYAYEMFDEQEIEIGNLARFQLNNSEKHCYVMAFGIERMMMHIEGKTNVWNTCAFSDASRLCISIPECDSYRKQILKSHIKEKHTNLILPQILKTYSII